MHPENMGELFSYQNIFEVLAAANLKIIIL
jgi:hypothetical protein